MLVTGNGSGMEIRCCLAVLQGEVVVCGAGIIGRAECLLLQHPRHPSTSSSSSSSISNHILVSSMSIHRLRHYLRSEISQLGSSSGFPHRHHHPGSASGSGLRNSSVSGP
ncbi:hypothetical protein Tco_0506566 [Tanacetum coccineum]